MKRSKLLRIVLVVALPIAILVAVSVAVLYSRSEILDVQISNVTSNGATLFWRTADYSQAEVIVKDSTGAEVGRYFDTRDLLETEEGYTLNRSGSEWRKLHFVSITNLEPELDYSIWIKRGFSWVEIGRNALGDPTTVSAEIASAAVTTFEVPPSLAQPDPLYGRVVNTTQDPLKDLYMQAFLLDEYDQNGVQYLRMSLLQSALTNTEGGWTMDMTAFLNEEGEQFKLTKTTTINVLTVDSEGRAFNSIFGLEAYKPLNTIVFDEKVPPPSQNDVAIIESVSAGGPVTVLSTYTYYPGVPQESSNYSSLPSSQAPVLAPSSQCSRACPAGYESGQVWVDPQYGCVSCNQIMCAQVVASQSQSICCGKRAINWDSQEYRSFAANVCGETIAPSVGSATTCSGGIRCDNTPIDYQTTFIGMQTCGVDFQVYNCTYAGWVGTGTDCRAQCQNAINPTTAPVTAVPTTTSVPTPTQIKCGLMRFCDGTNVDTDTTFDGMTICATGGQVLECTVYGWTTTGRTCRELCPTPTVTATATPTKTPPPTPIPTKVSNTATVTAKPATSPVFCPATTFCDGGSVPKALTIEGSILCGPGGNKLKCTFGIWEQTGEKCLDSCPKPTLIPDGVSCRIEPYGTTTEVGCRSGVCCNCRVSGSTGTCLPSRYPSCSTYCAALGFPAVGTTPPATSPSPRPGGVLSGPAIPVTAPTPQIVLTTPTADVSTLKVKVLPVYYAAEMNTTLQQHLENLTKGIEASLETASQRPSGRKSVEYDVLGAKVHKTAPPHANQAGCDLLYYTAFHGPWTETDWKASKCWGSGTADYAKMIDQNNICSLAKQYKEDSAVDGFEVWLFGFAYGGFWEALRAGPEGTVYDINGGTLVKCDTPVNIMGFNYQQPLDQALHSYGHRIERTLYTRQPGNKFVNYKEYWDAYAHDDGVQFTFQATQTSPCGFVHFPPNSRKNYDYAQSRTAVHWCDTWASSQIPQTTSCGEWGCNAEGFMKYWLRSVPKDSWKFIVADYSGVSGVSNSNVKGATADPIISHDDDFYRTTLDPGLYKIGDVTFRVLEDNTELIFFEDVNMDGVQQENEARVYSLEPIELEKVADVAEYNLVEGWNLLTMSVIPADSFTASELIAIAAEQGVIITHVATYIDGGWKIRSEREVDSSGNNSYGEDFAIVPGRGFFVKTSGAGVLGLEGNPPSETVPVEVERGWNLVGFPFTSEDYSGKSLFDDCAAEEIDCAVLSRYESGLYQSVIYDNSTFYGQDYIISPWRGYFLKVESEGRKLLTPKP